MLNPYINQYKHSSTQDLVESLVIQQIKMTGTNIVIFDKKYSDVYDMLLNEDRLHDFKKGITIEVHIDDVQEFNGMGNQLSFFGLELKDKITFTVSKKRYNCEYIEFNSIPPSSFINRPLEGNLVFLPLNNTLYEISRVVEDEEFLKTGNNFIWKMQCELFNPNTESIDFNEELEDVDTNSLVNNFEHFTHNDLDLDIHNSTINELELEDIEIDNPIKQTYT